MSFTPDDDNEFRSDSSHSPHANTEGMSSGTKVLLVVAIVFGILVIGCCGGAYYLFSQVGANISVEEADIVAAQSRILEADIPARFEPSQTMSVKFVLAEMETTMYEDAGEQKSQLSFMKMELITGIMGEQEAEDLLNENNDLNGALEDETSETKSYNIDGREIQVTISHGKLAESEEVGPEDVGKEWYMAVSLIRTEKGVILYSQSGPEETFDQAEIDKLVESFKFVVK